MDTVVTVFIGGPKLPLMVAFSVPKFSTFNICMFPPRDLKIFGGTGRYSTEERLCSSP